MSEQNETLADAVYHAVILCDGGKWLAEWYRNDQFVDADDCDVRVIEMLCGMVVVATATIDGHTRTYARVMGPIRQRG